MRSYLLVIVLVVAACDGVEPLQLKPADPPHSDLEQWSTGEARLRAVDPGITACPGAVDVIDFGATTDAWTIRGGALGVGPRLSASFQIPAVRAQQALLSTPATLPPCFVPLAVDLQLHVTGDRIVGPFNDSAILINDTALDASQVRVACLGARAFGEESVVEIRPRGVGLLDDDEVSVADVRLIEDPSCPAPGTMVPFSAWTANADGGTASLSEHEGTFQLTGCGFVSAAGPPAATIGLPNHERSALVMDVAGEPLGAATLEVRLGQRRFPLAVGRNRVCVPRALVGVTVGVDVDFRSDDCQPVDRSVTFTAPIVVDDPSCDAEAVLANGDFSSGLESWRHRGFVSETAGIVRLEARADCTRSELQTDISVPASSDLAGAALTIRYQLDSEPLATIQTPQDDFFVEVPASATLTTATFCLPQGRANELASILFRATARDESCDTVGDWLIDSVAVEVTPECVQ